MDIVSKVAERLKLSKEDAAKLRTTASIADADSESKIEAVWAGLRKGAANVATAQKSLSTVIEYPVQTTLLELCDLRLSRRETLVCGIAQKA